NRPPAWPQKSIDGTQTPGRTIVAKDPADVSHDPIDLVRLTQVIAHHTQVNFDANARFFNLPLPQNPRQVAVGGWSCAGAQNTISERNQEAVKGGKTVLDQRSPQLSKSVGHLFLTLGATKQAHSFSTLRIPIVASNSIGIQDVD